MFGYLKRRKARKEAAARAARDAALLRREASDRVMTRTAYDPRLPSGGYASSSDDLQSYGATTWAFDPTPSYSGSSGYSGGGGDFGGGGSSGSWDSGSSSSCDSGSSGGDSGGGGGCD
jgi:hypothetical protein